MRNTILATTVAVTAAVFAVSAQAADTPSTGYYEVGAASAKLDGETFSAVHLGVGMEVNKNLAVEMGGNVGLSSKTYTYNGANIDLRYDYDFGFYAVGKLPVTKNLDLLGRAGYIRVQASGSYAGDTAAVGDNGLALGVGLRYFPKGGLNGVRADITHFDFGGDRSSGDLISVSFIRRY